MAVNRVSDYVTGQLDRRGVLGEYSTGNAEFDEKMKPLNDARPQPEKFVEFYGQQVLDRDERDIIDIINSPTFQKERPENATLVEAVVAYGIANRGWLGSGAEVHLTSQFDDFKRGVDMLAVLPIENEAGETTALGLALDVTVSEATNVLEKKVSGSYQRLDYKSSRGNPGGKMTKLKYMPAVGADFEAKKMKPSKKLYNHYVIAIGSNYAKKLRDDFCKPKKEGEKISQREFGAQYQVIQLLRKEAAMQIIFALDKYYFKGNHKLTDNLESKSKNDFDFIYTWTKDNLDKVKTALQPKSEQDDDNSIIALSIERNLAAIKYLNALLDKLFEDNREMADTILDSIGQKTKKTGRESDDGLSILLDLDKGVRTLYDFNQADIRELRKIQL
jgi:hypothetical protein